MKISSPFRPYFAVLFIVCGLTVSVIASNLLFLWRTDDLWGVTDIVDKQMKYGGLYNGLFGLLDLKYETYIRRKPKIIVLGSSRSLQIREYFFTESFYNIGGDTRSINEAFKVLDRFLPSHKPEIIIYFLDYWHFVKPHLNTDVTPRPPKRRNYSYRNITQSVAPLAALMKGRLSWRQYIDILSGNIDGPQQVPTYGFLAKLKPSGLGPDGSKYYNLSGNRKPYDQVVDSQVPRFFSPPGLPFSLKSLRLVGQMATELKQMGITLVPIIAPVPPTIIDRLDGSEYVFELRARLKEEVENSYDYFDLSRLGVSDCEFMDNIHAGEVAYMRIIHDIAKRPNNPLIGFVDVDALGLLISKYANGVTIGNDYIGNRFRRQIDQQFDACQG